jgi:para-nitrobenzyl esterase
VPVKCLRTCVRPLNGKKRTPGHAPATGRQKSYPATYRRCNLLPMILLLAACSNTPVQVQTPSGRLEGYIADGVEHYLGIPYAQPPVGNLRWRPPQPVVPWSGVLRVQDNPVACPQFLPLWPALVGSEDCLYLNVWTPANRPAEAMPVMVWLHGGGFFLGKGSFSDDDGANLARLKNVVVVTVDYRLGVFGFLAHPQLSAEDPEHPGSGNYGLQDQRAALEWVRDHIAAFGGDPGNVTLFGQSAGAISVCAHLASPAARGLFQRAIIESGPCAQPLPTLASAYELGKQVAAGVNCGEVPDALACMRDKSAESVADVLRPDPTFGFNTHSILWWPTIDGVVLPDQIMDTIRAGDFNRVPVIAGATRDEATLLVWMSHNLWLRPLRADQYLERLAFLMGSRELAETVAAQYPLENYPAPFDALSAAFSDGFFNCPTRWLVQALSAYVPVWSYQFDYDEAPFPLPWANLGAFHAAEIQFVFKRPMRLIGPGFNKEEEQLAERMMTYWTRFVRSGDPNGDQLYWPRYDEGERSIVFNRHDSVVSGLKAEACRFWEGLDYLRPPPR